MNAALPSESDHIFNPLSNNLTIVDGYGTANILTTKLTTGESYESYSGSPIMSRGEDLVKGLVYYG